MDIYNQEINTYNNEVGNCHHLIYESGKESFCLKCGYKLMYIKYLTKKIGRKNISTDDYDVFPNVLYKEINEHGVLYVLRKVEEIVNTHNNISNQEIISKVISDNKRNQPKIRIKK